MRWRRPRMAVVGSSQQQRVGFGIRGQDDRGMAAGAVNCPRRAQAGQAGSHAFPTELDGSDKVGQGLRRRMQPSCN